jgi:hypothetical protein
MSLKLKERDIDATSVVYPGGTLQLIASRVKHIRPRHDPDFIVIMAGDIEARNGMPATAICNDMKALIQEAKRVFPLSHIITSGIAPTGSAYRRNNIQELNLFLQEMQADDRLVTYLDNKQARLRDQIHLTSGSKDHISKRIAGFVKRFF